VNRRSRSAEENKPNGGQLSIENSEEPSAAKKLKRRTTTRRYTATGQNHAISRGFFLRARAFAINGPCFIREIHEIREIRGSTLFGCGWPRWASCGLICLIAMAAEP
jgi:hypothetical protein